MRKTKNKATLPVEILNQQWTVIIYPPEHYTNKVGSDSHAEMDDVARTLSFSSASFSEELLRHELTHAYIAEMSFVALQLNLAQMEEFLCELNAKHAKTLVQQAETIFSLGKDIQWPKPKITS